MKFVALCMDDKAHQTYNLNSSTASDSIDRDGGSHEISKRWALGRKNWLFAGSLRSGKRAAAILSLIQSPRLNGLDP